MNEEMVELEKGSLDNNYYNNLGETEPLVASLRLTACDVAETKELLQNMKMQAERLQEHVSSLNDKIASGSLETKSGLSFLDVKNQLLFQYNINAMNLVLKKVHGQEIEGAESIDRLIKLRIYLEKLKPVEHKLNYQIDKYLKIVATGGLTANDPLNLKPNPANMSSKLDEDEDDENDNEKPAAGNDDKNKLYRPPMMASTHFEESVKPKDKLEKALAKAKTHALNTAMMKELHAELTDGPMEIQEDRNLRRMHQGKAEKERVKYEESAFVRLKLTKKQKAQEKQMLTDGSLHQLTNFGDISALTGEFTTKKTKAGKDKGLKGKKGKKGKKIKGKRKFKM